MQVSAGFDAHWRDPLAGLQFRTSTFHHLAAQVKQLADDVAGDNSVLGTSNSVCCNIKPSAYERQNLVQCHYQQVLCMFSCWCNHLPEVS